MNAPYGLAISGSSLLVANSGAGTVTAIDLASGATTKASFIAGLSSPRSVVVSGSDLFVANYTTGIIGKYDAATGAPLDASFISGLSTPSALAVYGGNLLVASFTSGTIDEYDAHTGALRSTIPLISGLSGPAAIAVFGNSVYVANSSNGTIGLYSASGATVDAAFISGLGSPVAISVYGSDLYVSDSGSGTIAEYDNSTGVSVNGALVSNLGGAFGMVVVPTPTAPTPAGPTPSVIGIALSEKKKLVTPRARLVIKGTASGPVTGVTYHIGKKSGPASGAAVWHFAVKLKPGKNVVTFVAHGAGGDSAPVKLTIIRRP